MPEKFFNDSIKNERRRRNQSYQSLDYMLSRITYFDFFSLDAFNIAKYSKSFAQIFTKQHVTDEFLLFSFLYCDSNLSRLLDELGLKQKFLEFFNQNFNFKNLDIKN